MKTTTRPTVRQLVALLRRMKARSRRLVLAQFNHAGKYVPPPVRRTPRR